MSFLSRAFSGQLEQRTIFRSHAVPPWSHESIYHNEGMDGPMSLSTFFACVRILADAVSSLPLRAYREKNGVLVPAATQPALFANSPYPGMTWGNWLWMLMHSLAVTGNAFFYIASRDAAGRATALLPVNPVYITVELPNADIAEWPDPIYRILGNRIPSGDILHIKRFPEAGRMVGLSTIEYAASTIGLSLAAERYGLRYFKDSASPSGILSTDADLDAAQEKRAMKSWIQSHQGRRLPAVMSGGLKWQSISITPEESQFLETRRFQRSEIAMWFGVPPHMIGDTDKSTSWGSGIDAQKNGFVTFTLEPWVNCIEEALGMLLPRGLQAKFDLEAILRGDPVAQWTGLQIGVQNGIISINEARARVNLPPIEGGDTHLQPMNFVPLGYVPPEPPASNSQADTGEEGT